MQQTTRHQANEPDPDFDLEVTETQQDDKGKTARVERYEADPDSEDGTGLKHVESLEPDENGELHPAKRRRSHHDD
jgi:hypothetical protein